MQRVSQKKQNPMSSELHQNHWLTPSTVCPIENERIRRFQHWAKPKQTMRKDKISEESHRSSGYRSSLVSTSKDTLERDDAQKHIRTTITISFPHLHKFRFTEKLIYSNVTGCPFKSAVEIEHNLIQYITSSVMWHSNNTEYGPTHECSL